MSRLLDPAQRVRVPEIVAYGLVAALGVAFVATSFGYGLRTDDGWVGPGFLPLVVGGLLFLLSGVELARRLRGSGHEDDSAAAEARPVDEQETGEPATDIFGRTEAQRIRQLWTVAAALLVAILLTPLLGLPVAFGLLVFFISVWVESRPIVTALVITGVSVAVVHTVFVVLLGVPLPGGLLGVGG